MIGGVACLKNGKKFTFWTLLLVLVVASFVGSSSKVFGSFGWGSDDRSVFTPGPAIPVVFKQPKIQPILDVVGYYAEDWAQDRRALTDLKAHVNDMQAVIPFAYGVDDAGNLTGPQNQAAPFAQQNQLKSYLLVHNYRNGKFDRTLIHRILTDSGMRERMIQSMLDITQRDGYRGVHIDFESVPASDRALFTAFMNQLSERFHTAGFEVGIAVPAKIGDQPTHGWSGAFDYAALNKVTDMVVVMTYDENWLTSEPGPVASYEWVKRVMTYASSQIDPKKLFMGVAAYGYDWSTAGNKAVMQKAVTALATNYQANLIWDPIIQEHHFGYTDKNGAWHDVWVETPDGIAAKIELAKSLHLKGIAIWRLGFTDDGYWEAIRQHR